MVSYEEQLRDAERQIVLLERMVDHLAKRLADVLGVGDPSPILTAASRAVAASMVKEKGHA